MPLYYLASAYFQPMKKFITLFSLVILFASCDSKTKKTTKMANEKKTGTKTTAAADTTPKVTGIGGIFFASDDTKKTNDWYTKNLGIEINDWGSSSFESRNMKRPDEVTSLQWKAFRKDDDYFAPSKKDFMINYTVQNLEGLLKKLKANGVTILDTVATYDFGKFVHIMDAEGNKIELWEPVNEKPKD